MSHQLTGMKVAALVEHGFEQSELLEPRKALEEAGARVDVVSPVEGAVKAWSHGTWGDEVKVDQPLADAHADEYDALLLPGGVFNPDRLRMNERAVQFVEGVHDRRSPRRVNLSRPVDAHRGRRAARPTSDVVAIAQNRLEERRRDLGRRRGHRGPWPGHVPEA